MNLIISIISFSFLLTLVSCTNGNIGRFPASLDQMKLVKHKMSDQEFQAAYNICYALRSKRMRLMRNVSPTTLSYRLEGKSCKQKKIEGDYKTEVVKKKPMDLLLFSTTGDLVQTDISGHLKPICKDVLKGIRPITSFTSGESEMLITFTSINGGDAFIVKTGKSVQKENGKVEWIGFKAVQYDVLTAAGKHYGVVRNIKTLELCSDKTNEKTLNVTLQNDDRVPAGKP